MDGTGLLHKEALLIYFPKYLHNLSCYLLTAVWRTRSVLLHTVRTNFIRIYAYERVWSSTLRVRHSIIFSNLTLYRNVNAMIKFAEITTDASPHSSGL